MKESTAPELVFRLIRVSALGFLLFASFSFETRQIIWKRDKGKCRCGKSKKAGFYLEVSHLNHDRKFEYYDSPSNGDLACLPCHLEAHKRRAGRNGLSREDNDGAMNLIVQRMSEKRREGFKI